jgi:hypothetical protein
MILIQDNFLDSVDEVRKIALSSHYNSSEDSNFLNVYWRGYRTEPLKMKEIATKILVSVCKFYNLNLPEYDITTYFHLYYERTKETAYDYENHKYHKDCEADYAGLIYLTPNPPLGTGTSILDGNENKIVNVENVYNRIVVYPGNMTHAPTNLFGDAKENARMVLPFFIRKNPWALWETTNGTKLKK